MLLLQRHDFLLRLRHHHALAVQLTVRTRMRLVAGRQQVGRDIAFGGDVGHDLDLVRDVRKLGEELGLGIALEHALGDGIARLEGIAQPEHVGVVEEELGLQNFTGLLRQPGITAERDVEQHADRGAALHMRQQFQREGRRDFRDDRLTEDNLLQEGGLDACGARGARQGVVDEEFQGVGAVFAAGVLDQGDDFAGERAVVDRFGSEALSFSAFDFSEVI